MSCEHLLAASKFQRKTRISSEFRVIEPGTGPKVFPRNSPNAPIMVGDGSTVNLICRENGFRENYLKCELITEN